MKKIPDEIKEGVWKISLEELINFKRWCEWKDFNEYIIWGRWADKECIDLHGGFVLDSEEEAIVYAYIRFMNDP